MSTVATAPEPAGRSLELAALAETANTEHAAYVATQNAALTHAIAAGEALTGAKRLVGHGGWQAWVAANCVFGHTTATNYTRIAANKQRVADMGLRTVRAALAELASPTKPRKVSREEQLAVLQARHGSPPFELPPEWKPGPGVGPHPRGLFATGEAWVTKCPCCGHDLYTTAPAEDE